MEHSTINGLPNELLEVIFNLLNMYDLMYASLVCRRWSDLIKTNQKYRHLEIRQTEKYSGHVKELLLAFNVCSLRITDIFLSHSSLRSILLGSPNLQYLSIDRQPDEKNKMIEPLPVMEKLKHLEIDYNPPERALPWHTIAPSLQSLKMYCSEYHLTQWTLLSGQLKQVDVTFHQDYEWNCFCQMPFSLLEELTIRSLFGCDGYGTFVLRHSLLRHHKFFRRNASLRRLCLHGIYLSEALVKDITNHSKKLTSLEIIGFVHDFEAGNSEPGSLKSLPQLPELKHLRLQNLDTSIFRECEALTSLQSLSFDLIKLDHEGTLEFLEDVFKIAPQLRCLELGSFKMSERATHFICNNFPNLTRLSLAYSKDVSHDYLSGIDRLPHLWYLELNLIVTHRLFTNIIPRNKVRGLTLHLRSQYDEDDLLRLPETFPRLDRLNLINSHRYLRKSTVDKLRQLLPTCAIKTDGQLFTNVAGETNVCVWINPNI